MTTTIERPRTGSDLLEGLRRERAAVYASGKVVDESGGVRPAWPVGIDEGRGGLLRDLVVREGARACLETGFAYGLSASFLLDGVLSQGGDGGRASGPLVTSVDPFQTSHWGGAGRALLRRAGVGAEHELHEGASELVLPQLVAEGQRFDLAFIDGDHRFEHAFIDVFYARRLVGPGRLIVLDDGWMPAVRRCAAFFEAHGLCAREPAPAGPGADKFILLRVTPGGDARAWDHHAEF
jgi:hypothetical protein